MTSVWTVLIGPVLITCTLSRKKQNLSSNTQLSMRGTLEEGGSEKSGSNSIFKQCRGLTP
ncbi:unnamed protein product [Staurois parvus]|uniref:Uncharacterized protein n=1 Tax=Staurois parvus TaxID=386267 RepID=A0ABN9FE29_9NEOB|nr:unnamed protein product [Staurois parvus]